MQGFIQQLSQMSVAQIVNIVCWVFFGVFVLFALIYFLFGLIRGWRYGTFRLIFLGVLIAAALITLPYLSRFVGNLDLSSYFPNAFNAPILVKDSSGNPALGWTQEKFGSAFSVLEDMVTISLSNFNVNKNAAELASYAEALAGSIVALVLLMVYAIIIPLIGGLLCMLLWHLVFVHFVPKENRKAKLKRGRWISALENTVIGIVLVTMFMSPLTSLINSTAYAWKNSVSEEDKTSLRADNSTYKTIDDAVNSYTDSVFAKAFFSWTVNNQDKSFDVVLTDWLTTGVAGANSEVKVSVLNELSSVAKIASVGVAGGLISEKGFNATNVATFAVSKYVPELLRALGQSDLVAGLVPFAFQIAMNIEAVAQYLVYDDTKTIDFFDKDTFEWKGTMDQLATVYDELLKTDIATAVVDENGKLAPTGDIVKSVFTANSSATFENIIRSFDQKAFKIFDLLIKSAACTQAKKDYAAVSADPTGTAGNLYILDALPRVNGSLDGAPDYDAIMALDLANEVANLFDMVVRVANVDSSILGILFDHLGEDNYSVDTNAILALVVENLNSYAKILFDVDVPASGSTSSSTSSDTSACLLDSTLVENALPKVFSYLSTTLNSSLSLQGEDAIDLLQAYKDNLFNADSAKKIKNVKAEFNSIYGVLAEFVASSKGKAFLKDLSGMPGVYFDEAGSFVGVDPDLLASLANGCKKLDNSVMAKAALPKAFNHFLSGSDSPLKSLGFSDVKFDFVGTSENPVHLGTEFSNLLTAYSSSQGLVSYLLGVSSSSTVDASSVLKGLTNYSDDIVTLLSTLCNSAMLNPVLKDSSDNATYNGNMYSILNSLFKTMLGDKYTQDCADALKSVLNDKSFSWTDELTSLVNVIQSVSDSGLVKVLASFTSSSDLGALKSVDFETLFTKIGASKLLTSFLGTILDDVVWNIEGVGPAEEGVSFKNITDWGKEGKGISTIVKVVADIGDLGNVDWLNSDPTSVKDILVSLAGSQIFKGATSFSKFMASKFLTSIKKGGVNAAIYFADQASADGIANVESLTFTAFTNDFESITSDQWTGSNGESSEALRLANIITFALRLGGLDAFRSTTGMDKVNPKNFTGLLDGVSQSKSLGRILCYHLFSEVSSVLGNNGVAAFKNANTEYLLDCTDAERGDEIAQLDDLLLRVLDPVYGLLDASGQISASNLSLQTASANFLINPLLSDLAGSRVFNSLSQKQIQAMITAGNAPLTAFQKEVVDLIGDNNIYGISVGGSTTSAEAKAAAKLEAQNYVYSVGSTTTAPTSSSDPASYYDAVYYANWQTEINTLTKAIGTIQEAEITDFSNFDFISFMKEDPDGHRQIIEDMLIDINNSKILYHALSGQIKNALNNLTSSGSALSFDLTNANVDYIDVYASANAQSELTRLSYIIRDAVASDLLSSSTFSLSSLNNAYIQGEKGLLEEAASSHILNELPSGKSGLTTFESLMDNALLKSAIYGSESDNTVKNNVLSYVNGITAGQSDKQAAWVAEMKTLESAVTSVDEADIDFSTFDLQGFFTDPVSSHSATQKAVYAESQRGKIYNTFRAINKSGLLYRAIPYQMKDKIGGLSGVAEYGLDQANFYYNGDERYSDGTLDTNGDGSVTSADTNEIATLTYIIKDAALTDFTSISIDSITSDDNLQDILEKVAVSYIFNTPKTGVSSTALETMMKKVLLDSTFYGDKTLAATQSNVLSVVAAVAGTNPTTSARFSTWSAEITKIEDVTSALPSGLDLTTFDLQGYFASTLSDSVLEEHRAGLNTLMSKLNACDLLYPGLAAKLSNSVGSFTGAADYGLDKGNYYYTGYFQNDETTGLGQAYTEAELTSLSYIVKDAASMNFSSVSLDTLKTDAKLRDLLDRISGSYVFNTAKSGETALETMMQKVLLDSTFYGDKSLATTKANVKSVVLAIAQGVDTSTRFANWSNEMVKLEDVADAVPTGLDLTSFDLKTYFSSDAEAHRLAFKTLLSDINFSSLLYPGMPKKINDSLTSFDTGTISLSGANVYYTGYFKEDATTGLGKAYTDDEIDTFSYILKDAGSLSGTDLSDLSKVDADKVTSLLSHLVISHIFNSTSDTKSETVAQKVAVNAISAGGTLDGYLYLSTNPKDVSYGDALTGQSYYTTSTTPVKGYSTSAAKSIYLAEKLFPQVSLTTDVSTYDVSALNGDTGSLKALLNLVKGNSAITNALKNSDAASLSVDDLSNLLKALNACPLYQDCVPNTVAKFLTGGSLSLTGVDFSRADSYYCYYKTASGVDLSHVTSFEALYDDSEIDHIANIINLAQSNMTVLSSIGTSSSITSTTITAIQNLLDESAESYVFHLGLAYGGNHAVTSSATGVNDDLTVFEQIVFTLYKQTHLAERAYSSKYDYAYADYSLKLYDYITTFNAGTLADVTHVGDWSKEIAALTSTGTPYATDPGHSGLLTFALNAGYLASGADFSTSSATNFQNLAPERIQQIGEALNGLDIVNDAVPYSISGLIEDDLGFDRYSTRSEQAPITAGMTSFDSKSSLGKLGHYNGSLTVTSTVTPSFSYSFDGVTYTLLAASSNSGNDYTYSLSDLAPFYFKVETTGTLSSIAYSFNSSDYFLDQAAYENGALSVLTNFASAIYTSGSYLSFSDSTQVTTFLMADSTGGKLTSFLDFIQADKGFYHQRFYTNIGSASTLVSAAAEKSASLYSSRDAVLNALMAFSYSGSTVDLGCYLGKDDQGSHYLPATYVGIETVFASASYSSSNEALWLKDNLTNALTAAAVIQNAAATVYGGYTIPRVHMLLEGLASQASVKSAYLTTMSNGHASTTSSFGVAIANGFLDAFAGAEFSYVSSGSYFTSMAVSAPTSVTTGTGAYRYAYLSSPSYPNFYETSYSADTISFVDHFLSASEPLRLSLIVSEGKTSLSDASKTAVASESLSLDSFMANASTSDSEKLLARLAYLGTYYDYFISRSFFHASTSSGLVYALECDFPDPLTNGYAQGVGPASGYGASTPWSFANVAAQILTA